MNPQPITLGSEAEVIQIVSQDDLASILGEEDDIFPKVFATSKMVALMEIAASRLLKKYLQYGKCSVGIEICVNHVSPASLGAKVKAIAKLIKIESNRYIFFIQAFNENRLIGEGFHKRAIVDIDIIEKTAKKK